jgi:SM-20-related protein
MSMHFLSAEALFATIDLHQPAIVTALAETGLIGIKGFVPTATRQALLQDAQTTQLIPAGIGHADSLHRNTTIRSDSIGWLDGRTPAQHAWLQAMEHLRKAINQQLYLGLFDYECHYACYQPGQFYRRHRDTFADSGKPQRRVLSTVCYLNDHWQPADGGELVVFDDDEHELARITPTPGTLVIFSSTSFPHEVLPTTVARYSLTGWFRHS